MPSYEYLPGMLRAECRVPSGRNRPPSNLHRASALLAADRHAERPSASQVADAFKGEVDKIESLGPALEASYFVEGCSLVVSGWGRGVRMPKELMDAIVGAAGARPTHALQPTACFAVTSAKRELEVRERL